MTNWIWLTAFKKHIVSVLWKHWKGVLYRNSSPKNENALNIYPLSGHLGCRWVCFFTGTDLEKYSMTSLAHQWILCSEWVPSEWESKQLIKTSQWYTSNPHHSSPSINLLWIEKLCVCKKQLHHLSQLHLYFNFKAFFLAKIPVHNP